MPPFSFSTKPKRKPSQEAGAPAKRNTGKRAIFIGGAIAVFAVVFLFGFTLGRLSVDAPPPSAPASVQSVKDNLPTGPVVRSDSPKDSDVSWRIVSPVQKPATTAAVEPLAAAPTAPAPQVAPTPPAPAPVAPVAKVTPTPAPKKATPPPAAATAAGQYSVQVGAFSALAEANNLKNRLGAKGLDAVLLKTQDSKGKVVYKVRVGHYASHQEADLMVARLKSEGLSGFVAAEGK